MNKKTVPVLVVLALVVVGIGAFFLGREFAAPPSLETPPAQSSTPEVSPDTPPEANPDAVAKPEPAPEAVAPEAEKEPEKEPEKAEVEQYQSSFAPTVEVVYVRQQHLASGVNVVDDYKNIDSANTVFVTNKNPGSMYLCIGVGYGDAEGYIQVMDLSTSKIGYAEESKFTTDLANDSVDIEETQKTPEVEVETPKVETPKAEEPKVETPKQETPKAEEPKAEAPKAEEPKQENNSGIPDYLLNDPDNTSASKVTEGSGIEGGHVGGGPGDGISWNN